MSDSRVGISVLTDIRGASQPSETGVRQTVFRWIDFIVGLVLAAALLGELVAMTGNFVSRTVTGQTLDWSFDVAHIALASLAYIGGAFAFRRGTSIAMVAVVGRLAPDLRAYVATAMNTVALLVAALLAWNSIPMLVQGWSESTSSFGLARTWEVAPFTAGTLLLALFAADRLLSVTKRMVAVSMFSVLTVLGLLWLLFQLVEVGQALATALLIVVFLVALILGCDISIALILSLLCFAYMTGITIPTVVPSVMWQASISSFLLLAVPFFVFAGAILAAGGPGERISRFVLAILGSKRGGAIQSHIYSMFFFSGLSGSKVADMSMVGAALNEAIVRAGYPRAEGAAVLAASAVMGETIPPSIVLLVLGSIVTISIGTLLVGGLVPAVILSLCLAALVYVRARRMPGATPQRFSWLEVGQSGVRAFPSLLIPGIIVYGIVGGIATPTEASSLAVIAGLILGVFVYRELSSIGSLWRVIKEACATSGMVLLLAASANALSYGLTIVQMPQQLANFVLVIGGNRWVFLGLTLVAIIFLGMLLEGLPALLILAPILMPEATHFGINPVHFGVILIIGMALGFWLPPIGAGVYVTSVITKVPAELIVWRLLPYWLVLFVGLLMVAAFPWITLGLPGLLHMPGA